MVCNILPRAPRCPRAPTHRTRWHPLTRLNTMNHDAIQQNITSCSVISWCSIIYDTLMIWYNATQDLHKIHSARSQPPRRAPRRSRLSPPRRSGPASRRSARGSGPSACFLFICHLLLVWFSSCFIVSLCIA